MEKNAGTMEFEFDTGGPIVPVRADDVDAAKAKIERHEAAFRSKDEPGLPQCQAVVDFPSDHQCPRVAHPDEQRQSRPVCRQHARQWDRWNRSADPNVDAHRFARSLWGWL